LNFEHIIELTKLYCICIKLIYALISIIHLNLGSTCQRLIVSGDHVEFLHGNSVDNIYIRQVKPYEEFKNVLNQLKVEKSNIF